MCSHPRVMGRALQSDPGLAIVFVGNISRARRTVDLSCVGHVFVASDEMTTIELILHRAGAIVFALAVVLAPAL